MPFPPPAFATVTARKLTDEGRMMIAVFTLTDQAVTRRMIAGGKLPWKETAGPPPLADDDRLLYCNGQDPEDSRLFLAKTVTGLGWTVMP